MLGFKAKLVELKPALILLYLSSTGFIGVFSVQQYLDLKFDPIICLSFMGLIFGIYTFNRFTDTGEDFANDISKFAFFRNRKRFFFLAVLSVSLTVSTLAILGKLNWWHLSLLLTGFGYSYRVIPLFSAKNGFHWARLKEIIFIKNFLVSFWWPASLLALPIAYADQAINPSMPIELIAIALFLTILNNTLFHDIMDEMGDRLMRISTLPTKWGSKASYRILWSINLLWIILTCLLFFLSKLDGPHSLFLIFLVLYPTFYTVFFATGKASRTLMEILTESDVILFSLGLWVLKYIS